MTERSVRKVLSLTAVMALVGAALGFACGKYESCDPGQVFQYNVCFPGLVDGGLPDVGAGGSGGGSASCRPPGLPTGDSMCGDKAAGFGEPCGDTKECRCGKDLCAIIPGQTCGFCTRSNCMADPSICPTGWTCFDASSFQPGYSLCINM